MSTAATRQKHVYNCACLAPMHSSTTVCLSTLSQHVDTRSQRLPARIPFEPIFLPAIFVTSLVSFKLVRVICSFRGACLQQPWPPMAGALLVLQLSVTRTTLRVFVCCISVDALLKIQHSHLDQPLSVEHRFAHWLAMYCAHFLRFDAF